MEATSSASTTSSMSSFKRGACEEKKKDSSLTRGENGHVCFTAEGLGSSLLALFDKHFQGISEHDLRNGIRQVLVDSRSMEQSEGLALVVNLFVLCWNSRWCRGGKGAKLPFYQSLKILYEEFPIPVIRLLPLIPEFGYWKDLLLLLQHVKEFPIGGVDYSPLESAIWDVYARQLLLDYGKLSKKRALKSTNNIKNGETTIETTTEEATEEESLTLSCAGKYAPREKKHFDVSLHAVSELCKRMFPLKAAAAVGAAKNNVDDDKKQPAQTNDINNNNNEEEENDEEDMVLVDHEEIEILDKAPSTQPTSNIRDKVNDENERPKKRYRALISSLNRALDVPEVKMCGNRFSTINLAAVPSRCMMKNQAAFANDLLKGGPELETGNRHPDNPDRVKCRQNLLKVLSSKGKGVKGAQCYPHEYVEQILGQGMVSATNKLTLTKKLVINSQWKSMRENLEEMVRKRKESVMANETLSNSLTDASLSSSSSTPSPPSSSSSSNSMNNAMSLSHLIPLSDVSGSMNGTPMAVAIGLGILCSELVHESFRDLVMTFSGDARWENLSGCNSFVEKVTKLKQAHWEGNTDFYNALNRVAEVVRKNKLKQEEIPNLLVISDMQFDAASGMGSSHYYSYSSGVSGFRSQPRNADWNTVYENIEKLYHQLGMEVSGTPYTPPIIIFWNVRAAVGFPVSGDQKGVMMLSGYSPALMKFILSGEFEKEVIEEETVKVGASAGDDGSGEENEEESVTVITKKRKVVVTPMDVMKKVLSEEKFNSLREVLYDPSVANLLRVGDGPVLPKEFDPLMTTASAAGMSAIGGRAGRGRGGRGGGRGGGRRGGSFMGRGGRGRGGRGGRRGRF